MCVYTHKHTHICTHIYTYKYVLYICIFYFLLCKKNENLSTQCCEASSYWLMTADKFSEILQANC